MNRSSGYAMLRCPSSVPALGWRWVLVLFRGVFSFRFLSCCAFSHGYPERDSVMKLPRDIFMAGFWGIRTDCSRALAVPLVPWGPVGP